MAKKIVIIGGGYGGLGAAALLARDGYDVTLLEKNHQLGGKAGSFSASGFRFDEGPSWYLMPDIFEDFFKRLGVDSTKLLQLQKLSPSYRVFNEGQDAPIDIFSELTKDCATFEAIEPGAGAQLTHYLQQAGEKYAIAKQHFMFNSYDSPLSIVRPELLMKGTRLGVLSNLEQYSQKRFSSPLLQKIVQYPAMFLGSEPRNTPALFSIMSHADITQGVWYPAGGIAALTQTLVALAKQNGATMHTGCNVSKIIAKNGQACGVQLADGSTIIADIIVSNTDRHHTETTLLEPAHQDYPANYWSKTTTAPSALLMYLGVQGKIPSLLHHNLFFSADWNPHFDSIFKYPRLPKNASFYVCKPSATDASVAPKNHENLFILVPLSPRLQLSNVARGAYAETILDELAAKTSTPDLKKRIVFQKNVGSDHFSSQFYSFSGSALGLAHTLKQSAIFRPKNQSKKLKNLYFVGADTNPGIGLPTVLISAQIVQKMINNQHKKITPLS